MSRWLLPILFASGFSALVFQTLWFYRLGLVVGNSVWASSLTLAAFMTGLGIGNAVTARFGVRVRSPLRAYGLLEIGVAVTGVGLLLWIPQIHDVIVAQIASMGRSTFAAQSFRLVSAFLLFVLPASCMGATLPLVARGSSRSREDFGNVLGMLYGANTIGAVVGALLVDVWLIGSFGVFTSAMIAGGVNLAAAAGAFVLSSRSETEPPPVDPAPAPVRAVWVEIALAAVCGFVLLALEVVWFRYLALFLPNSSLVFAIMLAVVLIGIGVGGVVGGKLDARHEGATTWIAPLLLSSAFLTMYSFAFHHATTPKSLLWLLVYCATLMLPVSTISGVLFTLLGVSIRRKLGEASRATGWLTVANTFGAAMGALVAAFALLPLIGVGPSVGVLASLYASGGLLAWWKKLGWPRANGVAAVAFCVMALVFPWKDAMQPHYENLADRVDEGVVLAAEEGLTETAVLIERQFLGERHSIRLVTNGFSMSASFVEARRYMKLYVYLPVLLKGRMDRSLLISFGVGQTAKALTTSPATGEVDVVDISRNIYSLADHVFPDRRENPLRDPRVRVHVEDGRHFLETTSRRYDLITSEPPPPSHAGIVSLYTRKYFELIHSRLKPGGIVTYWIPLHDLRKGSGASVMRAFCDVFEDCSLWNGAGSNLMAVGSRGFEGPVSPETLAQNWTLLGDPVELRNLGFEAPEQVLATFVADSEVLDRQLADVVPVLDDDPHRILDSGLPRSEWLPIYRDWVFPGADARRRFAESDLTRQWLSEEARDGTTGWFDFQELVVRALGQRSSKKLELGGALTVEHVSAALALDHASARQLASWMLDSDADFAAILESTEVPRAEWTDEAWYHEGVRRVVTGGTTEAVTALEKVAPESDYGRRAAELRAMILSPGHETEAADDLDRAAGPGLLD